MNTHDPKSSIRAALILAIGLCIGGLTLAIGIWLAAERLGTRLEAAVTSHAVMTRDAGTKVAASLDAAGNALVDHAGAVREAGRTISTPELRVVDPLPIRQPVKIEGPADDGSLNVNATVGKDD